MNKLLLISISLALLFLNGCADIPIKDGELVLNANSTASVEDVGVAKVRSQF